MDKNLFRKILPRSCLVNGISFAFFGLVIPVTTSGSHRIQPPNPFLPYPNEAEFKQAVKELYPNDINDFSFTNMLTDHQYADLFQMEGFAKKATYDAKKLIWLDLDYNS